MNQLTTGEASKFLVALFSAAASGLATYYGNARWEPVVVMGIGAVLTYLVPNASKPAQAAPQPAPDQPQGM